ncbi:hypothetical protein ASPCAL05614 [Aspergillus calidoustus]|uniref:Uncharacterized protein n=1 Tax=Aspergillus calidoustus TaxID=454130 RepID=A0A0U4Z4C0_ASPCI|nr:hypothetical protein ASPCAL05614 [Aspergillus calidoustus]
MEDDDEADNDDDLDDEYCDDDRDYLGPLDVDPLNEMHDFIQAVESVVQEHRGQPEPPRLSPRMEFSKPIFGIYNPKTF